MLATSCTIGRTQRWLTHRVCQEKRSWVVSVYNLLPRDMLALQDVSLFQGALQAVVKERAKTGELHWQKILSPRWDLPLHLLAR